MGMTDAGRHDSEGPRASYAVGKRFSVPTRDSRVRPSRRSTVMRALHRFSGVTSEYQSDSSSKPPACSARPISFVFETSSTNGGLLEAYWVLPHRFELLLGSSPTPLDRKTKKM